MNEMNDDVRRLPLLLAGMALNVDDACFFSRDAKQTHMHMYVIHSNSIYEISANTYFINNENISLTHCAVHWEVQKLSARVYVCGNEKKNLGRKLYFAIRWPHFMRRPRL